MKFVESSVIYYGKVVKNGKKGFEQSVTHVV
jgi:hypothetical protein